MDINFELNGNLFMWDAAKAQANLRKHGVRIEEAAMVFDDSLFVLTEASRNDEARDAAIGFAATGRLLYLASPQFTDLSIVWRARCCVANDLCGKATRAICALHRIPPDAAKSSNRDEARYICRPYRIYGYLHPHHFRAPSGVH